jgi:hypothetical protein
LAGDPVFYQLLLVTTNSADGVPAVNIFASTHGQRERRLSYQTDPMRIILDIGKI